MTAVVELSRRSLHLRVALVVVLGLSFLTGSVVTAEPAHATSTAERDLARYHNNARAARGIPKLYLHEALSDKARLHSRDMATRGYIFHTPKLAYVFRNWTWSYIGENVGVGPSMWELHKAFMNSTGHRANILKRQYRRFGIGTYKVGSRNWVTVIFMG